MLTTQLEQGSKMVRTHLYLEREREMGSQIGTTKHTETSSV